MPLHLAADGAAPDPATVDQFVSLGEASSAAELGIQRCAGLLAALQGGHSAGLLLPTRSL